MLVSPNVHGDPRGFLVESWREDRFAELGIPAEWVQENHARSHEGTVRGLHFTAGQGQAKLVRCMSGSIWDVVLDLRAGSPAFGEWEAFALNSEEGRALFLPVGVAHGFCATSASADVLYKCSAYYDASAEREIAWDDPALAIPWPVENPTVSERDRVAPTFEEVVSEVPFRFAAPA